MLRRQLITALLACLIVSAAHGQSAVSAGKSYELFSWKIKGQWCYSLLPRGGSKSYQEIISDRSVRRGTSGLESELRKLPKGAQVFWMSDAPSTAKKSATGSDPNMMHPSRKRIKHVKAICDKLGIKLKLA